MGPIMCGLPDTLRMGASTVPAVSWRGLVRHLLRDPQRLLRDAELLLEHVLILRDRVLQPPPGLCGSSLRGSARSAVTTAFEHAPHWKKADWSLFFQSHNAHPFRNLYFQRY